MLSAVQAVSQLHTGGLSALSFSCAAASSAGWAYFAQFSGKAPSAPQTGQSVFMLSAVQAVSQLHTGGVSVPSSAKAAVGIRHSSIHRASRVLTIRFFILSPSLFAVRWQHHNDYLNYGVNRSNCQVLFSGESIVKPKIRTPRAPSKRPNLILWDDLLFPFGWYN